ncbi:hypothetical protein ACJWDR_16680 [Streptomyces tauricus]|uniref:hypothetical protein n=1 Tax=Streptomyces tauricus TaxID=68274 RepID=UPI00387F03D9
MMASRQKPPPPDGSADPSAGTGGGSSVRRAVALGSVGADPGAMLAPATPPAANAPQGERESTGQPRPATVGGTPEGEAPEREAPATAEPEAESAGGSTQTASEPAQTASAASAAGAGAAVPDAEAATSMGVATGAGDARGDDEPPSGNPKKPLLAAAGIAGVVLLVVPLLIWATDDSEKKDRVSVATRSDTVLDEEPLNVPKGDYAPATPTAEPSSPKPSAEPKAKAKAETEAEAPSAVPAPEPSARPEAKKDSGRQAQQSAPKPAPNTAALAVQRLATTSPGRHVCYRAYVTGTGWQAPVCDGATAGAAATGRPIKALNIAVAGTDGTSANEYIQKTGWPTKWAGVANGVDLTIGTAAQNAPNMAGLAISVGKGVVCQNTRVHDGGWLGLGCDEPGGYIFGGTLKEDRWLEAVRLTV